MPDKKPLTYKDAGVDIDAGNALVERIKPLVRATRRAGSIGALGGFGGLFAPDISGMSEPVLVAGTDGVGTKLRLALDLGRHDTVGIDLVAMCVNDVIVQGAEPLFFLDYFACGRLDVDIAARVIGGIAEGCRQAGCELLGGETAEMPGFYADGDLDLAGFAVGLADRPRLIDGSRIAPGDVILGLKSSGPHSNGYSLIRKVLEQSGADPNTTTVAGASLAEALLAPTRIYVRPVLAAMRDVTLHGLAHITGGGLAENLARVLPDDADAHIDAGTWQQPAVFDWLAATGGIATAEMRRTFNCGIGMVVVVARGQARRATDAFTAAGEQVFEIGEITRGTGAVSIAP